MKNSRIRLKTSRRLKEAELKRNKEIIWGLFFWVVTFMVVVSVGFAVVRMMEKFIFVS